MNNLINLFKSQSAINSEILLKTPLKLFANIRASVTSANFSFLALVVGKHRAGKSLFSVLMASLLDPTFYEQMGGRVVYEAKDFIEACNRLREQNIRGGAIVWDEAGVGLPSREWYDIANKSINYALQVVGYLNPILIFVTQDASFLDVQPRKLLTMFLEVYRISTDFSVVKPFYVRIEKKTGKVYFQYPSVEINGVDYTLKRLVVPKPPEELIERYEIISKPWKDKIMQQMEERVKAAQIKEAKQTLDLNKIIDIVYKNYVAFLTPKSKPAEGIIKLDYSYIAYKFGLPRSLAKNIARDVEEKLKQEWQEKGKL